jgi:hypothetical protein
MMNMLTDFAEKTMRIPVVNLKTQLINSPTTDNPKLFLENVQRLFS